MVISRRIAGMGWLWQLWTSKVWWLQRQMDNNGRFLWFENNAGRGAEISWLFPTKYGDLMGILMGYSIGYSTNICYLSVFENGCMAISIWVNSYKFASGSTGAPCFQNAVLRQDYQLFWPANLRNTAHAGSTCPYNLCICLHIRNKIRHSLWMFVNVCGTVHVYISISIIFTYIYLISISLSIYLCLYLSLSLSCHVATAT